MKKFNTTTFSFDGQDEAGLVGLSARCGGTDIPIASADDLRELYETGLDQLEIVADLIGGHAIARGDTGDIAIAWSDGTLDPGNGITWICTGWQVTGKKDDAVTSQATFKPTDDGE